MQNWTRVLGIGRAEPRWRTMGQHKLGFVAFDSAKEKHAVAIAGDGPDGEVRYVGEIDVSPDAVGKLVAKLSRRCERLHFCYEA
jgi:transposase